MSIAGPERLAACLDALAAQRGAPPFEVVVAGGPETEPLSDVTWVAAPPSPARRAAAAIGAARGAVVLLTEDHCLPAPGWVRHLHAAVEAPGSPVGAAGGPVVPAPGLGAVDWAFHFSDFAPYVPPVRGGPVRSLSVCNAAYARSTLERVGAVGAAEFHETRVHRAIRDRVGPLVLVPEAAVETGRRPAFGAALRERFAFGRLWAAGMTAGRPVPARAARAAATAAVPALLGARLGRRALATGQAGRLVRGLPWLAALVLAWSAGEAWGAATGRPPADPRVAPDRADG